MPKLSTISELGRMFIRRKKNLSDGSREFYERTLRYLSECFGDCDPDLIGMLDAERFVDWLESRGMNATSINIYLRHAKAFFNWLVKREVIGASPLRAVEFLPPAGRPGKELYTQREVLAILAACGDDRMRLMVALAVTAGMRLGEILNLTIAEVDFEQQKIWIQKKEDTAGTWLWDLKDHESRPVPICEMTEKLLVHVMAELPAGQPYLCLAATRYQRLIARKNRSGLSYKVRKCPVNNFHRDFRAVCNKAGVRYKQFHALRGTCLTALLEHDQQLADVSRIAGHSSSGVTIKHYIREQDGYIDRARNALNCQWAI